MTTENSWDDVPRQSVTDPDCPTLSWSHGHPNPTQGWSLLPDNTIENDEAGWAPKGMQTALRMWGGKVRGKGKGKIGKKNLF